MSRGFLGTILVPTDFSKHSEKALQFASSQCKDDDCTLLIAHVAYPVEAMTMVAGAGVGSYPVSGVMTPPPTERADVHHQLLREQLRAVEPVEPGITVEHRLLEGEPAEEIVRLANETHATQIVIGSHGRRGLSRLLLGSVAEAVVRHATCPVTIVKADDEEEDAA